MQMNKFKDAFTSEKAKKGNCCRLVRAISKNKSKLTWNSHLRMVNLREKSRNWRIKGNLFDKSQVDVAL